MITKPYKFSLLVIAMLTMGFLSIWIGYSFQELSLKMLMGLVMIVTTYLLASSVFDISVYNLFVAYSIILLYPIKPIVVSFSVVIFIFGLLRVFKDNALAIKIPNKILFIILLISGTQAIFRSYSNENAILSFFNTIIIPFLSCIIIYNSNLTEKTIKILVKYNVYIAAVVGFIGVLIALRNPSERIGSTWVTAMTINGYYIINFFCGLAFVFSEKEKSKKIIMLILSFFILLGMLFTYTRISLLVVFLGLILIALREKRFWKFLIICLLLLPLLTPASMEQRVSQGVEGDTSTLVRLLAWYNSFMLIKSHPLDGIGFATFARVSKSMLPADFLYAEHSHNIYIHIMLEIGIIGFLAYFLIIFKNLLIFFNKVVRPSNSIYNYIFMISLLAIMLAGMTDIFIARTNVSLFFWFYMMFIIKIIKIHSDTTEVID